MAQTTIFTSKRVQGRLCARLSSLLFWFGLFWLAAVSQAAAQPAQPVTLVDVLVLYTPQARDGAGGTAAIQANIDVAMLEANTVLQNSLVNARLRLASAIEVDYAESGTVAGDLAHLRNPYDLYLGQASRLRDQYNADLVCLVTETGSDWDFYGLQGPSVENAFSIIRRPYLTGLYDFPVALSFNFGCQLERRYADSVGAFPYAYGYSFGVSNTTFSTVEAFSGQRLPFFSNPDFLYQGVAAGVPPGTVGSADNVHVLNQTAPMVAAFRGTAPVTLPPNVQVTVVTGGTNTPAPLTQGTNLTLRATASDPDGSVQLVKFYAQDTASGVSQFLGGATNAPFGLVWTNLPPGSWKILAQAVDNLGATTMADAGVVLHVVPANDDFANATVLTGTNVSLVGTTAGATLEDGEPGLNYGAPSVWYSWTAPANGRLSVSVPDLPSWMVFGVYTGTNVTNLTTMAWSDEDAIDLPVFPGTNYCILIAATLVPTNSFNLTLEFQPAPPNDDFENPAILSNNGGVAVANNAFATTQPGEPTLANRTLWWTWTAPTDGVVTFTNESDFSSSLEVYQGTVLTNLTFETWGSQASDPLQVSAGQNYQIVVGGVNGQFGNIQLGAAFIPRPANDTIANRITITGNWITLTNSSVAAIFDPSHPGNSGSDYNPAALRTLWWSWTAPYSGYVTISTSSGQYIDVLTGTEATNLTEVASGAPDAFEATAGTTYVVGATGLPGEVDLNLVLSTVQIASPTNGAVFAEGTNINLSATTTTNEAPLSQMEFFANGISLGVSSNAPFSIVWRNVPGGNLILTASGTDSGGHIRTSPPVPIIVNSQPIVMLDSPAQGAVFTRGDNLQLAADQTINSGTLSQIEFFANGVSIGVAPTAPYSLVWSNVSTGNYSLKAVGTDALGFAHTSAPVAIAVYYPVPPNDNFSNSAVLIGNTVFTNGTTLGGSTEPGEPLPSNEPDFYSSVWYAWTAPASGAYDVVVNATRPWQFMVGVYAGSSLTNLVPMLAGQTFAAQAGATYHVALLSADDFSLEIEPVPANDNFTNAFALAGLNVTANGDNSAATSEPYEARHAGIPAEHSVWYSWTAPVRGLVSVSAMATNFNPVVDVNTGLSVSNLTSMGSSSTTNVSFLTAAGVTYLIAVDGSGGFFTLNLSLTLPPANDDFAARQTLSGMNPSTSGTAYLATIDIGEFYFSPWLDGGSVWYSWVAPGSGMAEVVCLGHPVDVFTGSVVSNLTAVVPPGNDILPFPVVAGTEYEIAVLGESPLKDVFTLSVVLPKAQIVSPTNGAAFPAPANFEITARTIDIEGAVVAVSFYDGTNLLSTVTNAPFQISCTNVPAGSHLLSLQATDEYGTTTTSVPIEIRVQPSNDNFAQRFPISGTTTNITTDNSGATTEPGEFLPSGASGRTLWWSWTAPTDGTATINSSGFLTNPTPTALARAPRVISTTNAFPNGIHRDDFISTTPNFGPPGPTSGPLVAIYTNSILTNLSLCASNSGFYLTGDITVDPITGALDADGEWYVLPSFTFPVVGGQTYQISLDGVNGSFGAATMSLSFALPPAPPANDNFAQRTLLSGSSAFASGTTALATREPGEPLSRADTNALTVWYSWTAPGTGDTQIYEDDSFSIYGWLNSLDIGVYAGSEVTDLIPISVGSGTVSFFALAGVTYQIVIAGPNGLGVDFDIDIEGAAASPQIDAANTVRLPDGSYQVSVDGAVGQSFVLQASTDLMDWQTIRTDTMQSNRLDFVDSDAQSLAQRYYRTLSLESALFEPPFALSPCGAEPGAAFCLHLEGPSGQPFRLEASTNLLDWTELTTGVLLNEAFDYSDADAAQFYRRFYRFSVP